MKRKMKSKSAFLFKQIIAWCTVFALLLSFLPGYVLAAEEPAVSLEKAVQAAKAAFDIPKEFTTFSSGYNQYGERQAWQLVWQAEEEPRGDMYVQVDCQTAEILSMSFWQAKTETASQRIPAVSREEAVKIATALVEKLQAKRLTELKLEESTELLPLTLWEEDSYRIEWVRQVQGVSFPQDGITVNVDKQTGRITGYSFHWTEGDFPAAKQVISPQEARKAWENAEMFQLQYFYPSSGKPEEREVKLVYRLVHPSQGILDALTGEPLAFTKEIMINEDSSQNLRKSSVDLADNIALTPEEIKEIQAAGKVIPQKEAEAVVSRWVTIPNSLTLQRVSLNKDEAREKGARTWFFSWQNKGKTGHEEEVSWIEASVDAINGELLSFNVYKDIPQNGKQVKRLNREQAQEKAEAFLRLIQPQLFKEVRLNVFQVSEPPRPLSSDQLPAQQYFKYDRVVNDVVFPTNGFSISVDAATGEIVAYELRWQKLQFPSPEGILNSSQIIEQYLTRQPLTLQYMEREADANSNKEIRLVYRPVLAPGYANEAMCDARTGAALDWQGKPLAKKPHSFNFTDISGHWAEKEIALLGQAGILGEYAPAFRPEQEITVVQFLRALLILDRGAEQIQGLSDEEVMEQASKNGWIDEGLKADDTIERLLLARLAVRYLDLAKVAELAGIYTASYHDFSAVPVSDQGYVALAWGLGILKGEQDSFKPQQTVSRAQAAVTLVRLLKVDL